MHTCTEMAHLFLGTEATHHSGGPLIAVVLLAVMADITGVGLPTAGKPARMYTGVQNEVNGEQSRVHRYSITFIRKEKGGHGCHSYSLMATINTGAHAALLYTCLHNHLNQRQLFL